MAAFRSSEKVPVENEQFTISVLTCVIMLLCCLSRVVGMRSSSVDLVMPWQLLSLCHQW